MDIWSIDYFVADYLQQMLDEGKTWEEIDEKSRDLESQIHDAFNSRIFELLDIPIDEVQ